MRARLPLLVGAVVLLAVVAVGSARGALSPAGTRLSLPAGVGRLGGAVLLLTVVAALVLFAVVLAEDRKRVQIKPRRRSMAILFLPLFVFLILWFWPEDLPFLPGFDRGRETVGTVVPTTTPGDAAPTQAAVPLVAILVVSLLALVVVATLVRSARTPTVPPGDTEERRREELAELVGETIDDVTGGHDPRRAVIAAYARMERGLAAYGLPRHPSEAPLEYMARVLASADVAPEAITRLTGLFEIAKFSDHPVDEHMRADAVAALNAIRTDLRAAVRSSA